MPGCKHCIQGGLPFTPFPGGGSGFTMCEERKAPCPLTGSTGQSHLLWLVLGWGPQPRRPTLPADLGGWPRLSSCQALPLEESSIWRVLGVHSLHMALWGWVTQPHLWGPDSMCEQKAVHSAPAGGRSQERPAISLLMGRWSVNGLQAQGPRAVSTCTCRCSLDMVITDPMAIYRCPRACLPECHGLVSATVSPCPGRGHCGCTWSAQGS